MTRKVSWGMLGAAKIGVEKVIPAMQRGDASRVDAIASRDLAKARQAADQLGVAKAYGSYEELLADPMIEAIYNPLPNELHVEWTIRALEAGKHVLCEKPIALDAAEAGALIEARRQSGKLVAEAFMVRFHPQWHRIRELVRAGRIGDVGAIQSAFLFTVLDPNNVRNRPAIGGGSLYDVGCYPIVTARYVFGSEPERAVALMDLDPVLGVERLTSGILAFPAGRQLVFTSALQLAAFQRVVVLGSEGRI